MSTYYEDFSKRLATLRKDRGYTQYTFAEALNTPRSNVQGYESGNKFPKYEMLVKIVQLLGVSSDYMLGIDTDTTNVSRSIFVKQLEGLDEAYFSASRERQRTVDAMLKDIYVIMEAALKTENDTEIGLYIDLFDVARRITDATHGHE